MARLPRLVVPGAPHLVVQRGLDGLAFVGDEAARLAYLGQVRQAVRRWGMALHAYALLESCAWLVVTPPDAPSLSKTMQDLARRHASWFNRRQQRHGAVWEGRFGAAPIGSDAAVLRVMRMVETHAQRLGLAGAAPDWVWSSARHHLGLARDPTLHAPAAFWALGNTPFERELAWARYLGEGVTPQEQAQLGDAALKNWALEFGGPGATAALASRRLEPKPRGRPRRQQAAQRPP